MSNPLGLNEMLRLYEEQHGLSDGEAYPSHLGVFCDGCDIVIEGDFIVHGGMTRTERLAVVRGHATQTFGWFCENDEDLCANCRDGADPKILHAPWTTEQVKLLNIHQGNVKFHPFTCGRNHSPHRILT